MRVRVCGFQESGRLSGLTCSRHSSNKSQSAFQKRRFLTRGSCFWILIVKVIGWWSLKESMSPQRQSCMWGSRLSEMAVMSIKVSPYPRRCDGGHHWVMLIDDFVEHLPEDGLWGQGDLHPILGSERWNLHLVLPPYFVFWQMWVLWRALGEGFGFIWPIPWYE